MKLAEVFLENGYRSILDDVEEFGEVLSFLRILEKENIITYDIYVSQSRDEIVIIFIPECNTEIFSICQDWDNKIMCLLNHGNLEQKFKEKIRLNFLQIILVEDINNVNRSIEISLDVSRKIVIPYDSYRKDSDIEIEINDENIFLFPFVKVRKDMDSDNTRLKKILNGLLPNDEKFVFMESRMQKKKNRNQGGKSVMSLDDEQYKLLEEWITYESKMD